MLFGLALFLFPATTKLWISETFATDLPNWDQWDAEGLYLLLPWSQGTLSFLDLFAPHNEHRIALTKLLAIVLVECNGQWDARIQMLINGSLHSAVAVALWFWIQPLLRGRWSRLIWLVALLATFAPPHAWQNNLGGFHSQQYFLLSLSLVGLDRTLRCRQGSFGWYLGIASLALALFSMASGPAAAAITVVAALAFNGPPLASLRRLWPTVLAGALIVAAGLLLNVRFVGHDPLRAHSVHEFALSLWHALQWPVTFWSPFALATYAPWLVLCCRLAFGLGRCLDDRRMHVLAAVGGWVVLQFMAAAYARGADGAWPASRYFDTHTLGLLVNAVILLIGLNGQSAESTVSRRWNHALRLVALLWMCTIAAGLALHARKVLREDLPAVGAWFQASTRNTRLFLGTGDRAWLREPEIPYPSADVLAERLSHPELTAILPASVGRALPLEMESSVGFAANARSPATPALVFAPTWGSLETKAATDPQGEWWSTVISPPDLGYLKFEVAGEFPGRRAGLELWSADRTRRLASIQPSRPPGDTWRAAYVSTPKEPFRVMAFDHDSTEWISFSAPVPMATGSYWIWRLAAHAPLFAALSGLLLVAVAPWAIRPALPCPSRGDKTSP